MSADTGSFPVWAEGAEFPCDDFLFLWMEETGPSVENGIGNKSRESREGIKILKGFLFNYIDQRNKVQLLYKLMSGCAFIRKFELKGSYEIKLLKLQSMV